MKRFVCFLLTFLMIVSLVPATVLTASAASVLNTSDKAIEILKQFEGFSAEAYDHGGKHYIGYGTQIADPSIYEDGITKTEATALLKKHVQDTVDKAINEFAKKFNIAFTQYQHDALALFSYNCGTAWMSSDGAFRSAVVNGKKGNDFLNAICLYNGGNTSSDYFRGLMNRRLAEANMYLNNIYSSTAPSGYTYVVLDSNGGALTDSFGNNLIVFAYSTSSSPVLTLKPAKSGDNFLGWYLVDSEKGTETPVSVLDKTTSKQTLTAKWQSGTNEVTAKYTINSSEAASSTVYGLADMESSNIGTLKANSKFAVSWEKIVGDIKWVYGTGTNTSGKSITGWVAYKNVKNEDLTSDTVLATGTVTATTLNVREAATTDSGTLPGSPLAKGTVVKILAYKNEYTASGTRSWGKIAFNGGYGWINLAYVDLRNASADDNNSLVGKTGKIVNADKVNVRTTPGVGASNFKTTIAKDTKVTIYETKQVAGGATWGRIKWNNNLNEGWIYMYYVQVDGQNNGSSTGSGSDVVIYTGVVNSNTNLNIRASANVTSAQLGSLPRGTRINIYEKTTTNGVEWGRTDKGWVCLLYVSLTATGNTPSDGASHVVVKKVGTVTASALTLRKSATNNSEALDTMAKGDTVTIVEQKEEATSTGTKLWGKVTVDGVEGWINLAYVDIKDVTEIIPDTPVNPGDATSGTPVSGVIANCTQVNVRSAAGVRNPLVKTLLNGTKVTVYEQIEKDNAPWGRIDGGWVCMNYVTLTGNTGDSGNTGGSSEGTVPGTKPGVISATGLVNSNTDLNVRAGAGLGYAKVFSLKKGTKVTIYEQQVADGMTWGKINYNGGSGWICMSYVTIDSTSNSGTGVMGTVARCFSHVNVRSAPGVGSALVGTIQVGARVEVFEKRLYNGEYWCRVAQGWVCMQYIILDSELPETPDSTTEPTSATTGTDDEKTNPNTAVNYSFTGVVTEKLNVRKDAVADSDQAGTLNPNTTVNIVALKAGKDGKNEIWGKINDYGTPGWINLAYVRYEITGYVQSSTLTVFASASAGSEDIGTIKLNNKVTVNALGVEGGTVFGKIKVVEIDGSLDYSYVGWVDLSKIGSEKIDVTPELSSTVNISPKIKGKTSSKINAYTSVEATEVAFNLSANADVYIQDYVADHGVLWGKVVGNVGGKQVTAYVEIDKTVYVFLDTRTVTEELNVRSVYGSTADDTVLGQLAVGTKVTITSLAVDSLGNVWGQIQSANPADSFSAGNWINLSYTLWTSV